MKVDDMTLPDPMEIPERSIAPMISRLASFQSILAMRLVDILANTSREASNPEEEDEFLTTPEAAKLLNVDENWLYLLAEYRSRLEPERSDVESADSSEMVK